MQRQKRYFLYYNSRYKDCFMRERLNEKYSHLERILKMYGSVLIAFSGGVDSSFLAKVAFDMLKNGSLAVTSISPSMPKAELQHAIKIAEEIGIPHRLIKTREMENQDFLENTDMRCFFCKSELFTQLFSIARKEGYHVVAHGANHDDQEDFRPGSEAAKKLGAVAPLMEARLTKEEIRLLSKEMGLSTWNKPSKACLSSRIPFGEKITVEKLQQIEIAEDTLSRLGFHQFRVRHHGDIARIEIEKNDLAKLMQKEIREKVISAMKKTGFKFITLDLEGYRTGPFNPPPQISEGEET